LTRGAAPPGTPTVRARSRGHASGGPSLLGRFWASDWGLSALLVLLVVEVFITGPLVQLRATPTVLRQLLFTLILVSGVATTLRRRSATLLVGTLAAATAGVRWADYAAPSVALAGAGAALGLASCGVLAGVIIAQVFRAGPINAHRLQGAIAVYLLLAVMWTLAYTLVALTDPAAFSFPPSAVIGSHDELLARLGYFSLVTLTTVGYGDITPVHPVARSLAGLEALTGQLFPAILLARLVAMELYHRQERGR
jgi:hypothetical protein